MLNNKHLVLIFDTVPPRVSSSQENLDLHSSTGHAVMMRIYNVVTQLMKPGLNQNSSINPINAKTKEVPINANNFHIVNSCEEGLRNNSLHISDISIESLLLYKKISFYYRTEYNNNNKDNFDSDFLIPFLTVRRSLRKEFGANKLRRFNLLLGVTTDDEKDNSGYFPVSRYLFIESLVHQSRWDFDNPSDNVKIVGNSEYSQCFFYGYDKDETRLKARRFAINGIEEIATYLPIFPLNKISYKVFSSYVSEYFPENKSFSLKDSKNKDDLFTKISNQLENNRKSFKEEAPFNSKEKSIYLEILMKETIKLTCLHLINKSKAVDLDLLYEYCRNIPILSLLFLASLLKFSEVAISEKALISMIRSSQEYADGVLQLIENAVEHGKEKAYLRYRVKKRSDRSIANKYGYKYIPNENCFLEILLVDMSESSIPSTFYENLEKRQTINPFSGQELTIKDFFDPDKTMEKLWNTYYSDVSNITYHYGLKRFLSVIDDANGFFRVVTTSNTTPEIKDIFVYKEDALSTGDTHLPGTEYNIILPISTEIPIAEQIAVGFGVELDFSGEFMGRKTHYYPIAQSLSFEIGTVLNQQDKQERIEIIRDQISKFVDSRIKTSRKQKENEIILCFDMAKAGLNVDKQIIVDIFCKAIIQYLHCKRKKLDHRIAIINANHAFIYGFSSLFAVYCINTDSITAIRSRLDNTQIYLCDENLNNELLFIGGNLAATYQYSDYLASRKAVYPKSLQVLQSALSRKKSQIFSRKTTGKLKIAPFELCVNTSEDNCQTLFEKRVEIELQNDLQKIPLGCRLSNAHMRVGSKIHITDSFYDATLLLASSYYTQRFSYLLAKKIDAVKKKHELSSITLVGYEDYSESLIFETHKRLKDQFGLKEVTYTLYSEQYKDSFKFLKNIQNDTLFCIIVPVNSTLTTHTKVWAALSTKLKELGGPNCFKVENYALIVVSHKESEKELKLQEKYWKVIDKENRIITTKFLEKRVDVEGKYLGNPEVNYNVLLSSTWADPLTCDACFPSTNNFIDERPMLEVSKSSVMTYILSGLREAVEKKQSNEIANAPGSINYLKNNLLYGHILFSGNHFQFYIQTEKLMQSILDSTTSGSMPSSADAFFNWMKTTRDIIQKQREILEKSESESKDKEESESKSKDKSEKKPFIVYDIVVSPIQSMNGQFVHEIVTNVFENLQTVLYVDVQREFRENIEAKYSNLIALYKNNVNAGRRAVIRFHYVDSTISSGATIRRAQSLLRSLFPEVAYSSNADVKVILFDTVTLLVNRCSANTMDDYVKRGNFHRFIDVRISSIRSHRDNSCVLCNQKRNYELIMSCCSTNEMYHWWSKKLRKISPKSYEHMLASENQEGENAERPFLRLKSSHTFSDRLTKYNASNINDTDTIRGIIIQLFKEIFTNKDLDDREKIESLISYIKVMSRPFISYRKSTLEAIFRLLLELMEILTSKVLNSKKPKNQKTDLDYLYNCLSEIYSVPDEPIGQLEMPFEMKNNDQKKATVQLFADLFVILVVQLSELGAKYLMRKENIGKILDTARHLSKYSKTFIYSDFEELFRASIKRILVLNRDESIGLWLEWLLCVGEEYQIQNMQEIGTEKRVKGNLEDKAMIRIKNNNRSLGFYQLLFLENTYVIHDAILEFNKKTEHFVADDKDPQDFETQLVGKYINDYYFDNYRKFFLFDYSFQNSLLSNNPSSIFPLGEEAHATPEMIEETTKLFKLYRKLKEENNKNTEKYYEELCHLIRDVTNAKNVAILGCGWSKEPYIIAKTDNTKWEKYVEELTKNTENEEQTTEKIKTANVINDGIIIMFENNENKHPSTKIFIIIKESEYNEVDENKKNSNTLKSNKLWTLEKLFLVRKVLTFRSEFITKINKDFSNDLIESYHLAKKFFNLRLRKKAATHSPDTLREEACYFIERKLNEVKSLKEEELEQLVLIARMASDNLISELYVKYLSEEFDKKMKSRMKVKGKNNRATLDRENLDEATLKFDSRWIKFFESISKTSEFDGLNESTKLTLTIEGEKPIEFHNRFPDESVYYPFLFVFALFQNAIKYGLVDSRTVHVNLSKDSDYLTISNKTSIYAHPIEKPESTTIQAIRYYYETLGYNICVLSTEPDNNGIYTFSIKLPIVEEL